MADYQKHSMSLKLLVLLPLWFALISVGSAHEAPGREAQEAGTQSSSTPTGSKTAIEAAPPDSERVFGVVRTFGITNDKNAAPLSPRGKFRIFTQNVTDPFTFVGTALQAGIAQAMNDFPAYGQGVSGYAKRYGASLADFGIGEFMSTFAFPTLLREDPRYFREGQGSFKKRLGHSLASAVVTRTDSGRSAFNWSNSVGRIAAGGVSNLYYPAEDRGIGLVFSRAGIGMIFGTAGAVFSEFGPDIERKLRKKSQKQTQKLEAR